MAKTRSGYKRIKSLFGKYKIIPEEWDLKKLEEVGKIIGGGTPDSKNKEYWNGKILWAIPTDITKLQTNQIENTERKITKEGLDSSSAKLLPKGTILITSRATIGECAIATKPISTNQGFQSIICDDKNFNRTYIFYSIKCHKNELLRLAYGTTFLEINKTEIKKVMLPAPSSILEQQKIASILSGVDALIESTQKIIRNTEKLKKGLMRQLLTRGINHKKFQRVKWLFGKEIEIPEEWKCVILDRLTPLNEKSSIRMGPFGSSLKKHELLGSGKIKTLWIENIVTDKFVWKYQKFITKEKYEQLKGFTVKPNDLLMTMMGTLGKTAIVPSDIGTSIISSHLLKITPDSKKLTSKFLYYFLKSQFIQQQIIKESHGLVMGGLNTGIVKKLLIITPPINEQQKIASILSGVDAHIQKNQEYKEKMQILKKGLMQKLLTGKIRVNI